MYPPGAYQSNNNNNAGASSSSASNVPRPNPSPPLTPQRQAAASQYSQQASTAPPPGVRGRNRKQAEVQQLNNEIQLLQEELSALDKVPPASKACKNLVTFVENLPDPFLPNSDGVGPQSWPYDRPVKPSRCCWKF